jgi:branched-chain amino acid transport system ATP-binding protein
VTRLEVLDVTVAFGGRIALDAVNLAAEPGHITGLIGPNGAGKTTLFNVICGLQHATKGAVLLDGEDITRLAPFRRARRGLARTFQRLELFGLLTVEENLRLAATVRRSSDPGGAAGALITRLGLDAIANVRADRLPTGQARLVELGRALATRPQVLLLDEPASGQDDAETAAFAELLRSVASDGLAVILVEHDVRLVMEVCSTIHVLDLGRVIASGTPSQVRHDEGVIIAYLGDQLGAAS